MKKLKVLIVEDALESLQGLVELLKEFPKQIDIPNIKTAKSLAEAEIMLINGNRFDLSILDKYLKDGISLSLIKNETNRKALGQLVFSTIRKSARTNLDEQKVVGRYLVLDKPYNRKGVIKLMNEVAELYISTATEYKPWLVKYNKEQLSILQEEIVYIEVNGDTCDFYFLRDGEVKKSNISKPLIEVIELSNPNIIYRITAKHAVNKKMIDKINKDSEIVLKYKFQGNEITLPIPEAKITELKKQLFQQ